MTQSQAPNPNAPDPQAVAAAFSALQQQLLAHWRAAHHSTPTQPNYATWVDSITAGLGAQPERWQTLIQDYQHEQFELWQHYIGGTPITSPPPPLADRRFSASEWQEPYYCYLAQSYLRTSAWLDALTNDLYTDPQKQRKLKVFTRQIIDALCPANFPWSNPEAIKIAMATEGASLRTGLSHLQADLNKGLLSMTDEQAFSVGTNLAVTPGAVVFENALMQVLQYQALTPRVYQRPLVIIPPCINKYYILDLQAHNSFVRYAVAAGHTVFMVSWRNTPAELGTQSWDDYVANGVINALQVAQSISGVAQVNALGFCIGGTLLSCALAVLRARGDLPVASLTLLTTMLDFCDTGELGLFIDEAFVAQREARFTEGGVLDGRELAMAFASLRANDLIWPNVITHYLKGRALPAFDLLYWNSDSTNLPGRFYAQYLRHTYLENKLPKAGAWTVCDTPIDLSQIDIPSYVMAAKDDHIVPWRSAYASAQHLGGKVQFTLAASGHIAGVINPEAQHKRHFWRKPKLSRQSEDWLARAKTIPGSWWPDWLAWLKPHAGPRRAAPAALGHTDYPVIEAAPGTYVKARLQPNAAASLKTPTNS